MALLLIAAPARGELYDSLDAYPPRWQLDTSDCDARVTEQQNLSTAGIDGGGCETITFHAGVGSEAILVYPIEPVHPLNDLVATVAVMSAREGARVGLRVRFPYQRDPQTHRPISVVLYGATYDRPGAYETLGIGKIERQLKVKTAKLRIEYGREANLADPYVDALAINAYSGPGTTTLKLDQLAVRGMVPVGDHGRVDEVPGPRRERSPAASGPRRDGAEPRRMIRATGRVLRPADSTRSPRPNMPAFPTDQVIRIVEHHGEPLSWIRSLGFDAVLLPQPPTAEILREAIQTQMLIYAPPPPAPAPSLQTLLDPVVAWYLGAGVALDNGRIRQTESTVRRLAAMPEAWRRPLVIAPVERWSSYGALADAVVCDAALRFRGLPASEQSLAFERVAGKLNPTTEFALAVESSMPANVQAMNQAIAETLGVPPEGAVRWHAMLTQVMQCLEQTPRAVLFRSQQSLASGTPYAQQRSMALSYINRTVAMIGPWLASARPASPLRVSGAAYRCGRVVGDGFQVLLLTSEANVRQQVLAGDGQAVQIELPPELVGRPAWRLTGFTTERLTIAGDQSGAGIEIVSPDVAEVIVIGSEATLGARLDRSARRFLRKAAADRWQLAGDLTRQIRRDWDRAATTGATDAMVPVDLLTAAARTLNDAEAVYRAGDAESTLRLARRADAWAIRAGVGLTEALLPQTSNGQPLRHVSCPPLDQGRASLQTVWMPLMGEEGWSENLIAAGGMDDASTLAPETWRFGQRHLARSESSAEWISRGYFDGRGAIRLKAHSTTDQALGGGYEGTVAILSGPEVPVERRQAIRIDAMVRTLGFGGPHQGLLVYDNLGGQEMGVLVREASQWTPVRLYRQSDEATEVKVMFEVIGDGEAVVDQVRVRVWDPMPLPSLPLRRLPR
jgi:hypothetical protein